MASPLREEIAARVRTLAEEDIFGQMLHRTGRVATLATEGGDVKLDWVDGIEKALENPEAIQRVETESARLIQPGIRRILWAGMGGSVQTIYALKRLGLIGCQGLSFHPLDSTDPESVNRTISEIAWMEKANLDSPADLRRMLEATAMIGVSMGMTSEEPITHLEWFEGLLRAHGVGPLKDHIQVMTLPGSYLDQFARPRGCPMYPIQLDGENHTGGRFSAPSTGVFLRPVALTLVAGIMAARRCAAFDGSLLTPVIEAIHRLHPISRSATLEDRKRAVRGDPFIQLAAFIYHHGLSGRNKVVLLVSEAWKGIEPWIEQLVEESLGKGGRGFLIFYEDDSPAECYQSDVIFLALEDAGRPTLALNPLAQVHPFYRMVLPPKSLAAAGGLFLGWERLIAAYAALTGIVFAGQPAVESYKKYARDLRLSPEPVCWPQGGRHQASWGCWTLDYSSLVKRGLLAADALRGAVDAAEVYAMILSRAFSMISEQGRTPYLDFTFNGEITPHLRAALQFGRTGLAHATLHARAKVRCGPADYHSTEQSETDGPPEVISLRFVALKHASVVVGAYSDKFLLAQARGTWQAMEDAGRWILMMIVSELDSRAACDLLRFFTKALARISQPGGMRNPG